jgi:transposase-like protein
MSPPTTPASIRRPEPARASSRAALAPLRRSPDPRLTALIESFGLDEGVLHYVEELRWPEGVTCPRCSSTRVGTLEARRKQYCRDCAYHFRVTSGTLFHNSRLALSKWLLAVQLMLESDAGFPANRLQDVLGGSYKTAWFVEHRIRAAMSRPLFDLATPVALADPSPAEYQAAARHRAAPSETTASAAAKWSLARALIAGAYRRPSPRHLPAYWNETRWRAAHHADSTVFRETVRALLETRPLPYAHLVGTEGPGGPV